MTKKEFIMLMLLCIASITLLWSGYQRLEANKIICIESDIIRNISDEYNHDSVYTTAQWYLETIGLDTNYLNNKSYMY